MPALLNDSNPTFDYYTNRFIETLSVMLPLGSNNFSPVALTAKTKV
jgi:hypothetical protein